MNNVALAYVGLVVPDSSTYHNPAFNRSGNMFQENWLIAIKEAGLVPDVILSQQPLRLFPHSSVIWSPRKRVRLSSGLCVYLMPFLNLRILRQLSIGLVIVLKLVLWGWSHRQARNRIVFTYNLTEPSGIFTYVAARMIRAKAIAAVIDINIPGQTILATPLRRLDFWLQKKLIPRFDGLVVVNDRISHDFAPETPFVRIEGGIREEILQRFSNNPLTRKPNATQFTIVSVGTLNEANGFLDLLKAFALLPGDSYRLRIAGRGPLIDMVKKAALADPRIEYCGYLSFDQVLALYQTADVLINMRLTQRVNTSYFFPSKMMEYLASGVPVISTCTGHVEDQYSEFVFLLRDESPAGLARLIEQVATLDPDLRSQKAQAAREYILKHNSWNAQGRRVVQFIYNRVLN